MKNLLTFAVILMISILYSCTSKKTSPLKPPKNGKIYVVAHRGAHDEENIPENTLAAYQKAIDYGVDYVEIDVRMTKDGHFISMHNGNVNKYVVEDIDRDISEMTLAEVRKLSVQNGKGHRYLHLKRYWICVRENAVFILTLNRRPSSRSSKS